MLRKLKSQRGFAALIAILMVGMLTLLGLAALHTSDDEVHIAGNELQETRAFYAAETGLDIATATIMGQFIATGFPPTVMPSGSHSINGCDVSYVTTDDGGWVSDVISTGVLSGLYSRTKSFTVNDTAVNQGDQARVIMTQKFQTMLVPLFQWAIFYEPLLEIAPGAEMTLIGRVHSNGDLYVQAGDKLYIDSYMTAAGCIYHGRRPGCPEAVANGDVKIKDGDGVYVSMKLGSDWLDAHDSYWYDSSIARWDGRVQDSLHGQERIEVPITGGGDPHKMIERETGNPDSYEAKSTLKFVNNTAWIWVDSTWVNITDTLVNKGVIKFSANQFKDTREGEQVDVMELYLDRMYDSTFRPAATGVVQTFRPSNGVIWFSSNDTATNFPALRLRNGQELDTALTVASQNPVYTLGNYNSVNKKPAALMGDAITFLSSQWSDAKSALALASRNTPVNTTVNACYVTGLVTTTGSHYSGGFENLPRFLENWTGKTFTWKGSAVCMWESRQATGPWVYGTNYTAPNRSWSYDTDLDDPTNHPPASPMVRFFRRTGWKQEYVGYSS